MTSTILLQACSNTRIEPVSLKNHSVNVFISPSLVEDKVKVAIPQAQTPTTFSSNTLGSSTSRQFILGSRNSKLAMVQAEIVKSKLEQSWPGLEVKICSMLSGGDMNLSQPLYLLGGKELWTKELETALEEGSVDAIVHSLKDVPTTFLPGFELGAVLEREDPSDALVVKAGLPYKNLDEIPDGSVIGTSSVRRVAQLRALYPDLKFADIRGNLGTRLAKLDNPKSNYSALILASAGLIRLNLSSRITNSIQSCLHAVSQGAIGIEIREGDTVAAEFVGALEDWKTGWTTRAERNMLKVVSGGCSTPLGCRTTIIEAPSSHENTSISLSRHSTPYDSHSATITLTGTITSLSGATSVITTLSKLCNSIADCETLGSEVALALIARGGKGILEELGKHIDEVGDQSRMIPLEAGGKLEMLSLGLIKGWVSDGVESPKIDRSVFIDDEICLRPEGW